MNVDTTFLSEARRPPLADSTGTSERRVSIERNGDEQARHRIQMRALCDRARVLLSSGNFSAASVHAEELRERYPALIDGYILGIAALRQLHNWKATQTVVDAAAGIFPGAIWIEEERLRIFEGLGQSHEVIAQARAIHQLAPMNVFSYRVAFRTFRRVDRLEEADALLAQAISTFSFQPWICIEGAENAQCKGMFETADCLLMRGTRLFPHDTDIALAHAVRPARHSKERIRFAGSERSVDRLRALVEDFPDFVDGHAAYLEAFLNMQRPEEAARHLASRVEWFVGQPKTAIMWARIAEAQDNLNEAVARYLSVCDRFPRTMAGHEGLVLALSRKGNHEEAEAACGRALERFPGSLPLRRAQVKVAEHAGDLPTAIRRMEAILRTHPNTMQLQRQLYGLRLKRAEETSISPAEPLDNSNSPASADPKTVMQSCQGLGGMGVGCEFGLVQRHYGAEPLSLLRWGGLPHSALVEGIKSGFEEVDAIEGFQLATAWAGKDVEYVLQIGRYCLEIHTFLYPSEISEEKFQKQMHRRLKFLRQIFLDDLKSARHLFVRKQPNPAPSNIEIEELRVAMSNHGDNTVLYVFEEDQTHRCGTVEVHKPGVIFGYIDHFKDANHPLNTEAWIEVCTRAWEIWQSSRRSTTMIDGETAG